MITFRALGCFHRYKVNPSGSLASDEPFSVERSGHHPPSGTIDGLQSGNELRRYSKRRNIR
jgi:hypothetical protein